MQVFERGNMVPVLVLLEHRYDIARCALEQWASVAAPQVSIPALLRDIALAALRSGSDYWAGLAVNWLESGLPFDAVLRDSADSLPVTMSQSTRHRAFRVARRCEDT